MKRRYAIIMSVGFMVLMVGCIVWAFLTYPPMAGVPAFLLVTMFLSFIDNLRETNEQDKVIVKLVGD